MAARNERDGPLSDVSIKNPAPSTDSSKVPLLSCQGQSEGHQELSADSPAPPPAAAFQQQAGAHVVGIRPPAATDAPADDPEAKRVWQQNRPLLYLWCASSIAMAAFCAPLLALCFPAFIASLLIVCVSLKAHCRPGTLAAQVRQTLGISSLAMAFDIWSFNRGVMLLAFADCGDPGVRGHRSCQRMYGYLVFVVVYHGIHLILTCSVLHKAKTMKSAMEPQSSGVRALPGRRPQAEQPL